MAEKTKKTERKPLNNNLILMIVSGIVAVIIWFSLVLTAFPETTVIIKDVPVDYSLDGSYADISGLSIIGEVTPTVNVRVSGLRYIIGDYKPEDLIVSPNLDSVRASGQYELNLDVRSAHGDQITVDLVEPSTVHAEFDYFVTKTLSVEQGTLVADFSNISAGSGYILDSDGITITPSSITVSGPKDYVDQVTSCVVSFEDSRILRESANITATNIKLYSGNAVYDHPRVAIETESVNILIPVYMKKTLNLDVEVQTYFEQFDLSSLKYEITPGSIVVRSQNSALENLSELSLGYIDLRSVTIGSTFNFVIGESSYYTNISGNDTATVSFPLEGYATKDVTINNSQIYVVNVPDGFNATVETEKIRNITIVGPADVIEQIDPSDVIGQIDLLDYNITTGDQIMTVTVYLPNYNNVWANGIHKVYCHFEEIIPETAAEPTPEDGEANEGEVIPAVNLPVEE